MSCTSMMKKLRMWSLCHKAVIVIKMTEYKIACSENDLNSQVWGWYLHTHAHNRHTHS